ncbi:RraA family protein [Subtercola sp. YIM 133946]|uniref:RraA family protein n=1 Tax=Subtercola sp. YIM 133946 TaxID=3118909 RepID=UPI002F94E686
MNNLAEWLDLETGTVSDALDALGLPGSIQGIRAVVPGSTMVGIAYTVRYTPAGSSAGSVGDFLDDVPAGSVVAIDNGGRLDCTVWGGIMSEVALRRDLAGTAINGVSRDTAVATQLGYPLFTRGSFMRTGKDRVQLESVGEVISFGECQVRQGDLLIGGPDGLVVVPAMRAADVLDRARAIHDAEARIVGRVREGQSLVDARLAEGYHELQRTR